MTIDDLNVQPGRDTDRLIAEKVLGRKAMLWTNEAIRCAVGAWYISGTEGTFWDTEAEAWRCTNFSKYSTSIASAWELVDLMISKGYQFVITNCGHQEGIFACDFVHDDHGGISVHGETVPIAICRAVLLVAGLKP